MTGQEAPETSEQPSCVEHRGWERRSNGQRAIRTPWHIKGPSEFTPWIPHSLIDSWCPILPHPRTEPTPLSTLTFPCIRGSSKIPITKEQLGAKDRYSCAPGPEKQQLLNSLSDPKLETGLLLACQKENTKHAPQMWNHVNGPVQLNPTSSLLPHLHTWFSVVQEYFILEQKEAGPCPVPGKRNVQNLQHFSGSGSEDVWPTSPSPHLYPLGLTQ
jgi:hypothetical protein